MHDSEDTDAEGEVDPEHIASSSAAKSSLREQDALTQHKTTEGPLEGSAHLTYNVPIVKV